MRRLIAATLLVLFSATAAAAVPTTESIDTLLMVTRVERSLDTMLDSINTLMKQTINQAFANQPTTPEQAKTRDAINAKVIQIYREEMSWPKLRPLYVEIYQETFTQDEIDGLIAFYRTPTGVAYVDKLPIVLQKSLAATQSMMGPMMQKLQAAMKESLDGTRAATPQ